MNTHEFRSEDLRGLPVRGRFFAWNDWWWRVGPVGFTVQSLHGHFQILTEREHLTRRWHLLGFCVGPMGFGERRRNP